MMMMSVAARMAHPYQRNLLLSQPFGEGNCAYENHENSPSAASWSLLLSTHREKVTAGQLPILPMWRLCRSLPSLKKL